jgi:predicted RNA-binding Zn-ribbon protein involved in translation (DUF1610 family)
MFSRQDGPLNFFPDHGNPEKYPNPFYGVPLQWLPLGMDAMLWWANHFLLRFPFYRAAIGRVSNYFITSLVFEGVDKKTEDKYREAFEALEWKKVLAKIGLDLLAYSNAYFTVQFGFQRFLRCPKCGRETNIERIDNYEFDNFTFKMKCPKCGYSGVHEVVDRTRRDVESLRVIHWDVREIKVRHDKGSTSSEYFWDIPKDYIRRIKRKNNRFYSKKTPAFIFQAAKADMMVKMREKNFKHIRTPQPVTVETDGRSIPYCIFLFDGFFMLKVLERYNEVICFEDIAPFRVFSATQEVGSPLNPLQVMSGSSWSTAAQKMVEEHRKDPASYHIFPFPMNYQQLGGGARQLAPVELIQAAQVSLLNALNIPQELYNMNLQSQAAGPALRVFENSWSFLIDCYNEALQHIADVIQEMKGWEKCKVQLIPVTLADDMERKSMISQLVAANMISKSELLKLYNFTFPDQVRKKIEEDLVTQEIQEEYARKQQLQQSAKSDIFQSGGTSPTPQDVQSQAQEIAQEIFPLDGAGRRQRLQEIKAHDETLYAAVKVQLENLNSQARSQGVQQAQQAQQGGGFPQ